MGFFIEAIIVCFVIWFCYPFFRKKVFSIIEKREELKAERLTKKQQIKAMQDYNKLMEKVIKAKIRREF